MISKYDGRCAICGKPTKAGVDHYDVKGKQSYHQVCRDTYMSEGDPQAESGSDDAEFLAERLGYRED